MMEPMEHLKPNTVINPSLRFSFFILLFYFFSTLLVAGGIYILALAGFPIKIIKANLSEYILTSQILITTSMIFFLIKKYNIYLFSENWKSNFLKYLSVGLKWSIPLLIILAISILIPTVRVRVIENFLSMKHISIENISNTSLLIFSVWVLSGAIFEEIIFRGIFLQKLLRIFNATQSVFLMAFLFALSHCVLNSIGFGDLINAFIVGLLSGFAFLSTKSCISAIVPHLLNNAISIAIISIIR